MSGKAKKALAILAALGITTSGVIDFLNHVMSTFPNPKLHMICSGVITLIGLAVAVFPVSVKNPNPVDADLTPAETPAARTKQAGFVRMGVLLVVAALGCAICLLGCKTTYGAAYGSCVKASTTNWPETAAKIPAQVESIMAQASAGETVAALLEGLGDAYQDGGFLVSCALTAWTQTHPLAGDGGLPSPKLLAAHAGAIRFLAAHPTDAKRAASCTRDRV